jgi:hypothetical protein
MGTISERAKNDSKIDELIVLCCKGDSFAMEYLKTIGFVSRVMDDLIDHDFQVSDEKICEAFFWLLGGLWMNPFFITNILSLRSIHIASFNAWMDANKFERSDVQLKKIYGHVMKDFINELFAVVAFIIDGYEHMRFISEIVKETFLEEV